MPVVLAIIGLSVLVFFHELGHFLFAKMIGVKVEEFGFGYPPRICGFIREKSAKQSFIGHLANFFSFLKGKKIFGRIRFFWGKKIPLLFKEKTIYSLNWIPFGGFNKLKGELDGEISKDSFFAQTWWKKALVAVGGAAMNVFLAILLLIFLYASGIPQDSEFIEKNGRIVRSVGIQIGFISSGSPAEEQGLKVGDVIVGVDDRVFDQVPDIQNYIKTKVGQSVKMEISRGKQGIVFQVPVLPYNQIFSAADVELAEGMPVQENDENFTIEEDNYGVIGVALSKMVIVVYPWFRAVIMGIRDAFGLFGRLFAGIWLILKALFVKKQVLGKLFGPVGITVVTTQMARLGGAYFLQFIAFLSVAIGAFQIIPFPGLDGSRVLFAAIQGVKGKPISQRTESIVVNIGFSLLLILLFFITFKEIFDLF